MSPTADLPLPLSPKQIRSVAESQARLNIWTGSVRSGKTISSLLRWLIYVANPPRGGALVVVGKTLDTVYRNCFGPLQDPSLFGPIARLVKYTRGASTATILGRPIEIITANDARAEGRLRGLTCAGAYADELTLLPEEFFQQLLARCSVPGAKIFGTTNPDGPQHWLRKKFLLRVGDLDLATWHFTLDDNPALDPTYVENLKKEYVGLWYKRFILGQWVMAEGAIYDMWDEDTHLVDRLPSIERWLALGVDYGTVNPFSGLLLGLGNDRRLYLTHEWRWDSKLERRSLTDSQYSTRVREWLTALDLGMNAPARVDPEWFIVDPSAASFKTQLFSDGVANVMGGDNDVVSGIRTVASLLGNDRLRVHRRCQGWIDE
ncbi:hypothetical protein FrEUN1fDRAFT_6718, partial [Parafrankia sp. EUN1f]